MGGHNSGRRGGRPSIERTESLVLDINQLMRFSLANPGLSSRLQWTRGDGEVVAVFLTVTLGTPWPDVGRVAIRHDSIGQAFGRETGAQDYAIQLVSSPCHFGGRRWWFVCPRSGRRCGKLYLPNGGNQFRCRQAYGLVHQVRNEAPIDRAHRRIGRSFKQVGATYQAPQVGWPQRPKGMHQRTYDRLTDQMCAAEERLDGVWLHGAHRLLARLTQRKP